MGRLALPATETKKAVTIFKTESSSEKILCKHLIK